MARLKAREADREQLRLELEATAAPAMVVIPTAAEMEVIYRQQIARLEALLTGSDQIVEANALLRGCLGCLARCGSGAIRIHWTGCRSRSEARRPGYSKALAERQKAHGGRFVVGLSDFVGCWDRQASFSTSPHC